MLALFRPSRKNSPLGVTTKPGSAPELSPKVDGGLIFQAVVAA